MCWNHVSDAFHRHSPEFDGTAAFGVENGCLWSMMRHGKKIARLGRPADQRKVTSSLLAAALFQLSRQPVANAISRPTAAGAGTVSEVGGGDGDAFVSFGQSWRLLSRLASHDVFF